MHKLLSTSAICSLLLMPGMNTLAEPIDQGQYLDQSRAQIEKRQFSWPDGRTYDGEWLQGKPHGQGMLTFPDGGQYWGRFNAGQRQGEGMMKFVNGDEYEGEWFADKPHGHGTLRFANGGRYQGEFNEGKQSGKGRQTFADGTYYDGQWKQNTPHGFGRLTFISGGAYEGQFEKGQPHGHGMYYFANGDLYEGGWSHGQQEGIGRYDYATGGFYEGGITKGKRQGKGVLVTAMGQRFEGNFNANQPNGKGHCGTFDKMEACTYHNGKRVTEPTKMVAQSAPAKIKTASKTDKPAAITAATPVVAHLVPAPTPTTSPAKNITLPSTTTASNNTTIKSAIPSVSLNTSANISKTFTKTLQQEKQRIKALTIADLNPNRSDIYFNDNWQEKNLMAQPERVWWTKRSSLFEDQLEIISQHGDTRISMQIGNYKGPGKYTLAKVTVVSPKQAFKAESDEVGSIQVLSDEEGWISGNFHFNLQSDSGRTLDVSNGVFRVSDVSKQPRFLR